MSQEGGLAGTPACRHPALTSSLQTEAQPLPFQPPVLAAAAAAALRPGPGRLRVRPAKRRANSAATGSTAPRRAPARSRTTTSKPDAARAVPDTDTGGRCRPRGAPASAVRCREMYQRGPMGTGPWGHLRSQLGPRGGPGHTSRPFPPSGHGTGWDLVPPSVPLAQSIDHVGRRRRVPETRGCQGRPVVSGSAPVPGCPALSLLLWTV